MRTERSIRIWFTLLLVVGVVLIVLTFDTRRTQAATPKKFNIDIATVHLGLVPFPHPKEYTIPIKNNGNDSVSLRSIKIKILRGDNSEFALSDVASLPSATKPIVLDSLGDTNSIFLLKLFVNPKPKDLPYADTDGYRLLVIDIETTEPRHYFDTVDCTGVEPWIVVDSLEVNDTLKFFINDPLYNGGAPFTVDGLYYYFNLGNGDGTVGDLLNYTPIFTLTNRISYLAPYPLLGSRSQQQTISTKVNVRFTALGLGEYLDSVVNTNDSRNKGIIYLLGIVRAHLRFTPSLSLGDFANFCTPFDSTLSFFNPTAVSIPIDSLYLTGGTGGFEIVSPTPITFPVIVKPNETFLLRIRYTFPEDSLNGTQTALLVLKQPLGGEAIGFRYDTVRFSLNRSMTKLTLSSAPPPYNPNALDAPFRIPIYLKGDRTGKKELDNITVHLTFDNDLLQPIGVDRSGSLSEVTPANGLPQQPVGVWDDVTKTFSVTSKSINIAANPAKNNLLFTVLCTAFLTKDTSTTMHQSIQYDSESPCTFRVVHDSLAFNYASECGDPTIRDLLLRSKPMLVFHPPQPDPAVLHSGEEIRISFDAAIDLDINWKLYDINGINVYSSPTAHSVVGQNILRIPHNILTSSGVHILRADVRDAKGRSSAVSTKFSIVR